MSWPAKVLIIPDDTVCLLWYCLCNSRDHFWWQVFFVSTCVVSWSGCQLAWGAIIIVVIMKAVLMLMVFWFWTLLFVQSLRRREDTSASGKNYLKPETLNPSACGYWRMWTGVDASREPEGWFGAIPTVLIHVHFSAGLKQRHAQS